jgi:hypothetical protein
MKNIDFLMSINDKSSPEKIINGCNGNIYNINSSFSFEFDEELIDIIMTNLKYKTIYLIECYLDLEKKGKKISYCEESKKYIIKDIDK